MHIMFKKLAVCAVSVVGITALNLQAHGDFDRQPAAAFFATLTALCGARYEGHMTFPTEGQDSFAGKLLVATVRDCGEDEIRMPFVVGEDTSRTWVLSNTDAGLLLKHDHRHADGTEDEQSNYGGTAHTAGTALRQSFLADAFTAELIPAAATNVWTLSLDKEMTTLTYHLTRHGRPRFTAVLTRVSNQP